jgi:hypothetical protein
MRSALLHVAGLALGACLAACAGAASTPAPPSAAAAGLEFGVDPAGVPWALRPLLDELALALQAREDELAAQLIERLRPQVQDGPLAEQVEAWSRVLEGRALTRALAPRLECLAVESADGAPERQALWLSVTNDSELPLRLDCAPPRLVRTSTWIDARGELARNQEVRRLAGFEALEIAPRAQTRLPLGEFEPRAGRALAVREHIELEWTAGVLSRAGRAVPLDRAGGPACDYIGLAGYLPRAAVEPAELLRYALGDEVRVEPLIERAARIVPARYDEALDLLAAAVEQLALPRIEALAPALRWLIRDPALGADARGWQEWLRARHNRRSDEPATALDLPRAASAVPPAARGGLELP